VTDKRNADLCLAVIRADTELEVTEILREAGYWDDSAAWRLFSDNENNYASIGNQQADAIAAFVEKIINSVDARLVDAAHMAGVDPEDSKAPRSMREAVAKFFEGKDAPREDDGRIAEWEEKATVEGRLLTVSATGLMPNQGQPSLSVADRGEGQTPDSFPSTFLSLQRSNKLRIPFVQGKFNMGGTGALRFSKLQLIVSRRNPALLGEDASDRDREWGFTIVRRFDPEGGSKSSVFKYLAPVELPYDDLPGVLSFASEELPIFPEATSNLRGAYERKTSYGSLVKLYEYTWSGGKSNIISSGDGLLRRIDVGLPELALPVRLFECRPGYKGHAGSFATNALGLVSRLDRDKDGNLEGGDPMSGVIALDDGTQISLRTYVFESKETALSYRSRASGVVFGVNGQQHAAKSVDFFTRGRVGLSYLADSMLVYADCSEISGRAREDLFMNSRDRLAANDLSKQLEAKLESYLKNEPTLRELQNQRRAKAIQDKLEDDKPLNDVLQGLMKSNPLLSKMFLKGLKLPAPFPPGGGTTGTGSGSGGAFLGKRHPTYFRFKGHEDGEALRRKCHIGSRTRVSLETDAEDSYFVRTREPGKWRVLRKNGENWVNAGGCSQTGPKSGIVHLSFDPLPTSMPVGSILEYRIEVTDPVDVSPFLMELTLDVDGAQTGGGGGGGGQKNTNSGEGDSGNNSSLSLPEIIPVTREKWGDEYDELSALKVKHNPPEGDSDAPVYDFYVNIDNKFLLHSQKESTAKAELLKKQFIYGFVLVGLALIQDHNGKDNRDESESIENYVERTSRALAPILVPMIQTIGELSEDE